ncbi:hypothetical protein [Nocardioides jishulii]|uniref:Uncharacterized protein n=1 Tax=Nocardioides jishulii TaxID=2575440 RepID=A0A4U2YM13_9ACTN|nr:hypothetical protein [Nocardioides jishulii]QCX27469.1 hypothetical protein FCL41_07995 [Nocardioides jishulii]TKI62276.1 hypothetical protein FC770_07660 [Nocardioides jishulii]
MNYTLNWAGAGYSFRPNATGAPTGAGLGTAPATLTTQGLTASQIAAAKPLVVTATNAFTGARMRGATSGSYQNMRVSPGNIGGLRSRGLTLLQDLGTSSSSHGATSLVRQGHSQVLTLGFNRPVKNLQFTVTDIDSANGQYQDRLIVSGTRTFTFASALTGNGTPATTQAATASTWPFRNTGTNSSYDPATSGAGNVTVNYGPTTGVSTVQVTFWNDQAGNNLDNNGLQGIFISDLTFTAMTC